MSANRRRGEIDAELDGKRVTLCLTLGALAELESAFAVDDLNALVDRFKGGRMAAADMIRIIGAGLRGAGAEVTNADVGRMGCVDGAVGLARIVSELLAATFGAGGVLSKPLEAAAGETERHPFPWEAVMSLGLGVLRLVPRDFWAMTPLEFAYAAGLMTARHQMPTRGGLDALMRQFPDGV